MTIEEQFDLVMTSTLITKSTKNNYEIFYRLYIRPAFGDKEPNEISKEELSRQFKAWSMQGAPIADIKKYLNALTNGIAKEVKVAKPYPVTKILTRTDMATALKCTAHKYYKEFVTLALTGMRPAELRGLQWQDLKGSILHIRRMQNNGEILPVKTPRSDRKITLPGAVVKTLKSNQSDWIFTMRDSITPIKYGRVLRDRLKTFLANAGIDYVKPYSLRHYFATRMLREGMPLKAIQRQLGHSSLQMLLDVYSHATSEDFDQINDFLNDASNF